jgi:dTDP-4-amino-4,6-dideoxygalactose transaminase
MTCWNPASITGSMRPEPRAELAAVYTQALSQDDAWPGAVRPAITPGAGIRSAWHIFPVLLDPRVDRTAVRAGLREAGVQTSVHYPPLHLTRAFSAYATRALPNTEDYARRTVTLPLFPHMTEAQQSLVLGAVRNVMKSLDALGQPQ